jgi:hypothetical protein
MPIAPIPLGRFLVPVNLDLLGTAHFVKVNERAEYLFVVIVLLLLILQLFKHFCNIFKTYLSIEHLNAFSFAVGSSFGRRVKYTSYVAKEVPSLGFYKLCIHFSLWD